MRPVKATRAPTRAKALARGAADRSAQVVQIRLFRLGETLRRARLQKQLSVETLAERAGVASGSISEIERGQGNPAYGTLYKISDALGLSVLDLFHGAERDRSEVVRRQERMALRLDTDHVAFELLTSERSAELRVVLARFPRGAEDRTPARRSSSEQVVHVLKGHLDVTVGERTHSLGAGDTLTFDGRLPHSYINAGAAASEAIIVFSR